jgi:predicted RNA-binding protein
MYQINSKAENAISPLQLLLQNCIASLTAPFCIPLLFYLCIQISNAAPVEHPTYEPGVLYLPDRAIAVGKFFF